MSGSSPLDSYGFSFEYWRDQGISTGRGPVTRAEAVLVLENN